ncbi:MAG: GatB/YqeY domain-containing protein, partial [Patescibacteria group bacterium]
MGLSSQLNDDLKTAMLAGDSLRVNTLKMLKSAIGYAEVDSGKRETGLSDEEIVKIVAKEAKKRTESIEMYKKAGADDRAHSEEVEFKILKSYLPEQMPDKELKLLIEDIFNQGDDFTPADLGKVIG